MKMDIPNWLENKFLPAVIFFPFFFSIFGKPCCKLLLEFEWISPFFQLYRVLKGPKYPP